MRKYRLGPARAAVAAALCGVVTMSFAVGTPAGASHGQTANTGVLDTANWQVCAHGGAAFHDAVGHAKDQISRTDVTMTFVDCHGDYNVYAFEINSPDNYTGQTTCKAWGSGNLCKSKWVAFNTRMPTTQTRYRRTACHEFGHVAGLGHRSVDSSCMKEGPSTSTVGTFDGHDISSINATY